MTVIQFETLILAYGCPGSTGGCPCVYAVKSDPFWEYMTVEERDFVMGALLRGVSSELPTKR
jgi:hypothetical protein